MLSAPRSNQLLVCVAFKLEGFSHEPKKPYFLSLCDRIKDEYLVFNACSNMYRNKKKKNNWHHSSHEDRFPFGIMEYIGKLKNKGKRTQP